MTCVCSTLLLLYAKLILQSSGSPEKMLGQCLGIFSHVTGALQSTDRMSKPAVPAEPQVAWGS